MTHDAPDLSTQNRIHADAPNSYLPEVIAFAALSFYVVVDTQIEQTLRFRMFNRRNQKKIVWVDGSMFLTRWVVVLGIEIHSDVFQINDASSNFNSKVASFDT